MMSVLTISYYQFWHLGCWQDVDRLSVEFFLRVRTDTAVCRSSWPSLLCLLNSSWPFCRDRIPENDVVRTCAHVSVRLGDWFDTTENAFFSCIYIPQITIPPTSSFTANFNGNRVKHHGKPWTCPLIRSSRKERKKIIVQELCESRGGRPGLSVLTSLLVSVDVKIY